ncbi:acetyl-CoA carboxylase carboxyltransferase subunit alpha [Micromonospora sp. LAH09]|uniref:acetyl-CoA carboxylase carboxyltransferase subunit alpha n=1 Tax=Micromonospora cabrerizensis TaxID=2911213 RepID=UPI001EE94475|nr:acetyl-CoA carboxylase carboxyltransferase subunit alpha [Micromonospora cabrerizensis]MCG5468343.1 acetyl-CoA carboxylase carboxyltransferase subunit alpha [Micromonospora cabrerizensis]
MTQIVDRVVDEPAWVLCPGCTTPVYGKRWLRNLSVCPECGRYTALTAVERLTQLVDGGRYERLDLVARSEDPLQFVDTVPYPARLAEARARTGLDEAVLCARGAVEGVPVVLAVMDFHFMGGSLGSAVGELITLAAEVALAGRTPLVIVSASGGARMQEGVLSLMQMAKTAAALAQLDEAGLLTVSLITDPTFGGVAASFATLCDVILAEPGARLGFAGRRVIEQTIRQQLPAEFQTAEFLLDRGVVDRIVPRPRLRAELGRLLRAATTGTDPATGEGPSSGDGRPDPGTDVLVRDLGRLPEVDPWEQVRRARDLTRPTTLDYLATAFVDFQELHGDRISGDCPSVVGGTAMLDGRPVVVIGQQKGHTAAELSQRNFGMPMPSGYRKAARLMRLAEKLRLPVVTLVDTPGAYPGADAEEQGQAVAIAENLRLMATLTVPVVTVIIGEGGSGGALALAVANRVLAFTSAVYSVISPEGCAAILWKDPAAAPRAAAALRVGARDLLRLGVVDAVMVEPDGGTGADPLAAAEALRRALAGSLRELRELTGPQLRADRRARFRQYGSALTVESELRTMSQPRR